jgi:hypothetical protein
MNDDGLVLGKNPELISETLFSPCIKCSKQFDAPTKCPYCGSGDLKAGSAKGTINRILSPLLIFAISQIHFRLINNFYLGGFFQKAAIYLAGN